MAESTRKAVEHEGNWHVLVAGLARPPHPITLDVILEGAGLSLEEFIELL